MPALLNILRDVDIDWGSGDNATKSNSDSTIISMMNNFLQHYKLFVIGFIGLADLTMVIIFLWLLFSLASGSTNFASKNNNTRRLLVWCVCMALLGALNLILALIYNAFK
jgi:hypothetical protein